MACQEPRQKRYSWYRLKPTLRASRIDFALTSQLVSQVVSNVMYFKGIRSDHSAMLVKYQRGTWILEI